MSTGDSKTTQSATTAEPQGWLAGPVSRGLALVLLAANLVVLGLMAQTQAEALERLERNVASLPAPDVSTEADPELCWLVGSLAYASGQGEKLKTVLDTAGRDTPCATDALRGAAGVNR